MARMSSTRATPTALLSGLAFLASCSAPLDGAPPPEGAGLTIIDRPADGWQNPCALPDGTRFTVELNERIGSAISMPGQLFTARVSQPVSFCDTDVIAKGAMLRGRVVDVATGDRPRLALGVVDVQTKHGPAQVAMVIRSVEGYAVAQEDRPFRASVIYGSETNEVEIPASSDLVIELSEGITILP